MKKTICAIFVAAILYCCCINALAVEWTSVELLSSDAEPLLPRVGEYTSQGYIAEVNGEKYIVGRQVSKYTVPVKEQPEQTELWEGQYYMLRYSGYDEVWSTRGIPIEPVQFYDKNGNLIYEHTFENNVCAIGYFNKAYYCQLFGTWQVYKSTDMKNWEEVEEEIPRQTADLTYTNKKVSFDNINMIPVIYENAQEKEFCSTFGEWILKIDGEYNFYLSNDNIYFVKIDMPYCNIEHDGQKYFEMYNSLVGFQQIETCKNLVHLKYMPNYEFKCIYEYEDNIILDMQMGITGSVLRLKIQKQDIYDELNKQKNSPYIKYNNEILAFEQAPVIENDRTLIPIRFLFEQMGATVDWNGDTQTATISQNDTAITFAIDNTEADVNGQTISMDVPARLINGKTMVPLRFLSENLGYDVSWDGETRIITIE